MSGVQDRYQRSTKDQRAAEFRRVSMQRDLQHWTAWQTIDRCMESESRHTPGTFAHDILTQLAQEAGSAGSARPRTTQE